MTIAHANAQIQRLIYMTHLGRFLIIDHTPQAVV